MWEAKMQQQAYLTHLWEVKHVAMFSTGPVHGDGPIGLAVVK